MIINPIITFLGIRESLPYNIQSLVQKFLILASFQSMIFFVSGTFYILFIIDKVGYAELGILAGVSFLVQATLDYPSGSLGDWIGQRWTLAIAFFTYGLSYLLLVFANNFTDLLIVYILVAVAASQESGSLQSWFDNNYRYGAKEVDVNRRVYQLFQGKISMILGLLWAVAILIGGILATYFFREIVFMFQSIGMFFLALASFAFVKDLPGFKRTEVSPKKYFLIFIKGLKFTFTKTHIFFFVVALCVSNALWSVWGNMILFPLYFGYTGNDLGAGIFRFLAWIGAAITAAKAAQVATRLNEIKWIPRLELFVMLGYFGFFAILIAIFPLNNNLNLTGIILTIAAMFFLDMGVNAVENLRQKLFLDLIPDEIRNSIYSLIPTLTLIVSAPVVSIAGGVVETIGFPITLGILAGLSIIAAFFYYISTRMMPPIRLDSNNENSL